MRGATYDAVGAAGLHRRLITADRGGVCYPTDHSGGGAFERMNPVMSVRFRLFALCVGLLAVMGGANLLLTRINQQHEAEVALLQEQYRRVSVIYAVQRSMATFRFLQGQVNAAVLAGDSAAEKRDELRIERARGEVQNRLSEFREFDAASVDRVERIFAELSERIHEAISALAKGDKQFEVHMAKAGGLAKSMEDTLLTAIEREQTLADIAQRNTRARAAESQKISILIMVVSGGFGLLLTAVVINSIIRPMQSTVKALRLVNAGETFIDMPPVRSDEFGDMAVALRQFRDQAENLRRLAYSDSLTGLGNRARLEEALGTAIDTAREMTAHLALLYIDLDNFRTVNDSLGHSAGDRYLCEAVDRLRRFAPDEALVCRYGGDKFTVLLKDLHAANAEVLRTTLRNVANSILAGMVEPFELAGNLLPMSVSIGIAVFPEDGQTSEQLVSNADAAMYLAKRNGRNNMQFATPELTGDARRQLSIVTDIRRGLESSEFEPFYQPIVDTTTGFVAGAEALLRWRHPQRGIVAAGEFFPAAEASGLIHALGEQCIRRACVQADKWARASDRKLRVSVNLSARQIEDRTALLFLQRLHAEAGPAAKNLDFEITETAILQHLDRAQATLKEIRELGHQLSVDDFGTGYSSLVYLQRFPVNRIKIDRSFVSRLGTSREAQAIIAATIALARSLDLDVVAEGVETAEQMRALRSMGCKLQQGYYFTPALPAHEFDVWCATAPQRLVEIAA
jgi:diguanylate cyclase